MHRAVTRSVICGVQEVFLACFIRIIGNVELLQRLHLIAAQFVPGRIKLIQRGNHGRTGRHEVDVLLDRRQIGRKRVVPSREDRIELDFDGVERRNGRFVVAHRSESDTQGQGRPENHGGQLLRNLQTGKPRKHTYLFLPTLALQVTGSTACFVSPFRHKKCRRKRRAREHSKPRSTNTNNF